MTNKEMEEITGSKQIRNTGANLRKFGMLKGESSNMRGYHRKLIVAGQNKINKKGVRGYCVELGKEFGCSPATIRSDYAIMKRYGLII